MFTLNEFLFTALCLFVGILLWRAKSRRQGLPPGPTPLPFIGNVLQIGSKPHLRFAEWAKVYGPVFKIQMGSNDVLVVSDQKLLKEIYSDYATTGRMLDNPAVYEFNKGANGVINAEGRTWEEQRRFTLRTLREFGFAKTSMEGVILDEARALVDWMRKREGKAISGVRIFNAPVVNSLWRIVTGERFEWEGGRTEILEKADEYFNALLRISTSGVFFAPVLRHIAPEYLGWNAYLKGVDQMLRLFEKSVQTHKESFDRNNIRDLIDNHLLEIEKTKDPNSSFYQKKGNVNTISVVFDLFVGGSETTSHTTSWTLLYLINHQTTQKKLQDEIDSVLGSREPSLTDRVSMPYTEAIINEVLRITSIVPMGVPHRMHEEKMFHGFLFPKGVSIFANVYGIHMNPEIWGDPENFRPERFLSEDGRKVVNNDALIPFSVGKRFCPGEKLARDTLFLFIVSIFQQFSITPGEEIVADFEPELGFFLVPKPFKMILTSRK